VTAANDVTRRTGEISRTHRSKESEQEQQGAAQSSQSELAFHAEDGSSLVRQRSIKNRSESDLTPFDSSQPNESGP
jgi:hypothetical protein